MAPTFPTQEFQQKMMRVLDQARLRGAEQAEAYLLFEKGFSISARAGAVETVEHHQAKHLQVSVYKDYRSGSATTSDLSIDAILSAVDKACAIADYAGRDTFAGLANPQFLARQFPDLKLYHHWP